MQNNDTCKRVRHLLRSSQTMKAMRLTTILLLALCLHCSAKGFSQKVTLSVHNTSIERVLDEIRKQTGYTFFYKAGILQNVSKVSISAKSATIQEVLNECFKNLPYTYAIGKRTIVISVMANFGADLKDDKADADAEPGVTVKGRIVEAKDPPLPLEGVTVVVEGNNKIRGTTNANGEFKLANVPINSTIIITLVGYKTQKYIVRGEELNLIFSLEENLSNLDQVVVTGFQKQKVREIASSVSVIRPNNLESKPITQLSQALQGGATGINVQQTSGLVGGDQSAITIRGIATIGSSAPLVIVDGVPMDMNNIDPTTVASITILKDASSTALYGARGSNGVILVTTKRGRAGAISVNYNGYYGIQKPLYTPNFVDAPTYMKLKNLEVLSGGGSTLPYTQGAIDSTASGADRIKYPSTNWADYALRKSMPIQSHSLMVSGGNTTARFVLNVNHIEQVGQLQQKSAHTPSVYSRTTATINTTVDLSNSFIVYTDVFASRSDKTEIFANGGGRNTSYFYYNSLYVAPPNLMGNYPKKPADQTPAYIKPGTNPYYGIFGESWNPAQILEHGGTIKSARDLVQLNLRPQWAINSKFKLNGQVSYNVQSGEDITNQDAYTFFNYFTNQPLGTLYNANKTASQVARTTYFYWGSNLDYKEKFGVQSINAVAGYSQELSTVDFVQKTLRSMYLKLYYSYDERFLLEAGIRRDGSSLFAPNNRYGHFPSVAAAWNIDKDFRIKGITGWKLRASWGITGNNNLDPYKFQNTINSNGTELQIANPNIRWEKNNEVNIGTDIFTQFGLSGTVEWFNKKTSDVIITPLQDYTAGITGAIPPINAASIRVRGLEISLNYTKVLSKKFTLNGGAGFTKLSSLVLKVLNGTDQIITTANGNPSIIKKGLPFMEYYGYHTQGLLSAADSANPAIAKMGIQHPGDIRYANTNGDSIISSADQVPLGSTQPNNIFFGHIGFNYAAFDFDVMADGISGSPLFYTGQYANPFSSPNGLEGIPQVSQLDTWTPTHTNASLPRISQGGNTQFSDYWKKNGAYVRIRYIQLGYTLPVKWINKIRASSLRIYFNAQDPFTFSHVKLFDPETAGSTGTIPPLKSYIFGINLKF